MRRHVASSAAWTSAIERYKRALDRYDACLRLMPERALREELTQLASPLEAALEDFEAAMARRPQYDEARDAEVLGCVHRSATLCAHATEAALMANEAAWRYAADDVARCLDTVRQLVKRVGELGDEATSQR